MSDRPTKMIGLIKEVVAKFIQENNNGTSLITVTNADISPDFKNAKIYITVIPESMEKGALDFCKRKRKDLKLHLKKRLDTRIIPFIDIELDKGEKLRRRIDEISMSIKKDDVEDDDEDVDSDEFNQ
jgi:ribosome-binding factor A